MTAQPKIPIEGVAPTELEEGDLVVDGSILLQIEGEPQTMHSGLGLFDDFRVTIRAQVEDIETGHRSSRIWDLDAVVIRRARSKADEDDS